MDDWSSIRVGVRSTHKGRGFGASSGHPKAWTTDDYKVRLKRSYKNGCRSAMPATKAKQWNLISEKEIPLLSTPKPKSHRDLYVSY